MMRLCMMKGSGQGQLNYSEQLIEVVAAFGCTSVDRAVSDKLQEIDEDPQDLVFSAKTATNNLSRLREGGRTTIPFKQIFALQYIPKRLTLQYA
eukprot:scaffold145_cov195-Alexandrium_tamarense.AAC.102